MIETHAAFGAGIGVRYEVILSNNPQIFYFRKKSKSERFAGLSGGGNR